MATNWARHGGGDVTEGPDPDLSVLVVNWNTRAMTIDCLESLYAQTREVTFETILVDNGSQDGSADAIAATFPQVRLMAEPINHGFGHANNLAAARARGRYLLLLNSDTVVLDQAVDRLMAFAAKRPEARIWGGRTIFADGSLNIGSAWGAFGTWSAFCFAAGLTLLFPRSNLFNPEGLGGWDRSTEREVDIVSGCFFLIERSFWEELGGFAPDFFMYGEEAELCGRARRLGALPRTTPTATIIHHGQASASNRYDARMRICEAKVELARRTMGTIKSRFTCGLMIIGVGVRALLYRLAAGIIGRLREPAEMWGEVWARRRIWSAPKRQANNR